MTPFEPGFADEPAPARADATPAPVGSGSVLLTQPAERPFVPGFIETSVEPPAGVGATASDPGDVETQAAGGGAFTWIAAGVLVLLVSGSMLALAGFAVDQAARSPLLGAATIAAYALGLGVLGRGIAIEIESYRRLAVVDRLRVQLENPRCSAEMARQACRAWLDNISPNLADATAIREGLRACTTAGEVRALLRHKVLEPLWRKAQQSGRRAALQGGAVVAITPSPALDGLFAGLRSLYLIREVAAVYGLRPSASVTVSLVRRAAWTATSVAGIELTARCIAEQVFPNAPVLKHVASVMPGVGLTAQRLYRLASAVAEACSPLARNA